MMDAAPPQYLADVYERLVGAPSAAPADRERRLSDVTEDDLSLESTSPAFRVCTLNIGGRNTNSFEFEMRGDATQLGTRWGELFGRGMVHPVDDFRVTNPPTNPALLDALAQDFVGHRYDLKHLLRRVTLSNL